MPGAEFDPVLLSGLVDACWVWPSSCSGLELDVASCFLAVLCNDGDSVNFSASHLELGRVSADDGADDSVAAGLAGVKPNAESFMQDSASCFFFIFFCVVFAVMRR